MASSEKGGKNATVSFMQYLGIVVVVICALSLADDEVFLSGNQSGSIRNNGTTVEFKSDVTEHKTSAAEEQSVQEPEKHQEQPTVSAAAQNDARNDDNQDEVNRDSLSVIVVWDESEGGEFGDNVGHLALALNVAVGLSSEKHQNSSVQLWTTSRSTCFEKLNNLPYISPDELEVRQGQLKQQLAETDQSKSILFDVSLDSMEDSLDFLDTQQRSFDEATKLSFPFLTVGSAIRIDQMTAGAASLLLEYTDVMSQSAQCCSVNPGDDENVLFLSGDDSVDASETMARQQIANRFQSEGPWVAVSRHRVTALAFRSKHVDFWREFSHVSAPTLFCYLKQTRKHVVGPAVSMLYSYATFFNPESASKIIYTLEDANMPDGFAEHDPRSKLQYQGWYQKNEANSSTAEGETTPGVTETNENRTAFAADTSHIRYGTEENPVTIMTVLSGEMANQLSKISSAEFTRLHLRDKYGIHANIKLQHQPNRKWVRARDSVVKCFPKLRDWDFEAGNGPEYDVRYRQQQDWLGNELADSFKLIGPATPFEEMDETLDKFVASLNRIEDRPTLDSNATITLPFLTISIFGNMGDGNDKYQSEICDLFEYDLTNPRCCKQRAEPDEHVFHVRGFLTEMYRVGKRLGFEELSANKTANELMGSLGPGDKVAITSRFESATSEHKQALEDRGVEVRVISGQTGNQDFCFLMSAEKEMIGPAISTFSIWAAYLGNASLARLYSVKSKSRVNRSGPDNWFSHYNYTYSPLKERIQFEGYMAEDQERRELLRR